jgi:peptidyl-tRNA hydrolase
MKMYILILDDVPLGHAVNSAAHAGLACFLKFAGQRDTQKWLADSFRKVTCKVSADEVDLAIANATDYVVMTESALGNRITAVAFAPRPEWPELFKTFSLYQ